ncbi:SDR family NAD(P)-dependent oxidoreductase [Streptomyces sp. NPDC054884]|uniref:SDR family NAD(P)-dependent oxidoreductase n=1 Tax=Streptomyces sp. ME08-AFT2 TaxID=3028683 RepID=UPI0029BD586C|nr:SDR family oxidoreductase [Streptomyces sp. ME08-AFT2]MDX3311417.1 SDR family NAD(P)-dependent oxidoreductase [Streptomyces sp. ME08-AFT2]
MSEQRRAVVTGAASGIGAAVAGRLLRAGWAVTGWDRRSGTDSGIDWHTVDVRDAEAVHAAAEAVPEADLLVNSAGVGAIAPSAELRPKTWERVLGVNLSGTFYCAQALFPALAARGGLVVNVASVMAHRAVPGRAAYCASKAGVVMLTEVLGVEWAEHGVRVLAVSPAYVRTPLVEKGFENGNLDEAAIAARTPLGRLATPDEVADLVLDLTGDRFAYMTASTLRFDGGWVADGVFPR